MKYDFMEGLQGLRVTSLYRLKDNTFKQELFSHDSSKLDELVASKLREKDQLIVEV